MTVNVYCLDDFAGPPRLLGTARLAGDRAEADTPRVRSLLDFYRRQDGAEGLALLRLLVRRVRGRTHAVAVPSTALRRG